MNVPCEFEKNVCSVVVGWIVYTCQLDPVNWGVFQFDSVLTDFLPAGLVNNW